MREKSSVSALTPRPPERLRSAFKNDFFADLWMFILDCHRRYCHYRKEGVSLICAVKFTAVACLTLYFYIIGKQKSNQKPDAFRIFKQTILIL